MATLDNVLGAQAQAAQAVQSTTAASLAQKQLADQAARGAHAEGSRADAAAQLAADIQRETSARMLAAAQTRLAGVTPAKSSGLSPLHGLLGGEIGDRLGVLGGAAGLGGAMGSLTGGALSDLQNGAVGTLLGMTAPLAWRGLKAGASRPVLPIVAAGLGGGAVPQGQQ